jgi:hypothetical protein
MNPLDDAITTHARALWLAQQRDEIERAISNAKRSSWDKWFRREWYRATWQIARRQRPGAGTRRAWHRGQAPSRPFVSGTGPRRWRR